MIPKSFILGVCSCGCNESIPIKRTRHMLLQQFKHGHNLNRFKSNNPNWKSGIYQDRNGYVYILRPNHKFAMKNGYVSLHRYRMELVIGRYLTKKEEVHHIDSNPTHNDESNLRLFNSKGEHLRFEKKIDMSNRQCLLCNSNKTNINSKGIECWYRYQNELICKKCYNRNNKHESTK